MPASDWIAEPVASHRHDIEVPLEPERALAHGLDAPVAPDLTVRTLFRLRGLNPNGSIEGFFTSSELGFVVLERTPTCFTGGVATQVWPPRAGRPALRDPAEWNEWERRPGVVRAVIDFQAHGRGSGRSELSTETRVAATDAAAARAFRAYWFLVSRPSSMIRRRWLRAMSSSPAGARPSASSSSSRTSPCP